MQGLPYMLPYTNPKKPNATKIKGGVFGRVELLGGVGGFGV